MEIKLMELGLTNFKGIKKFEMTCNGDGIKIYGDNATGKTTLFDAFLWLLFGKDSEGKKEFEIKTLNSFGEPIHKLDHTVEATLDIDGTATVFRKVYKENWVKKHGTIEPILQGHKTNYWIDDVPTKKKDYDTYITNLIDETTFKLLTDIRYFTEKLHWKERRDILTDVAAVHMDPVEMPSSISELIGNKSLDDYKKIIAEKIKNLKEELKAIPIRIDELNRSMPNIKGIDFEAIKEEIKALEIKIEDLNNQGKQITEHNNKLFDLKSSLRQKESLLEELKQDLVRTANQEYEKALFDKDDVENTIFSYQNKVKLLNRQLKETKDSIENLETRMDELRNDWIKKSKEEFNGTTICPTCNQEYPVEQIEQIKKDFKATIKQTLDNITSDGKMLNNKKESLELEANNFVKEIKKTEELIKESNLKIESLQKVVNKGRSAVDCTHNSAWVTLESEIITINTQIEDFKEMDMSELGIKKTEVKNNIQVKQIIIAKKDQHDLAQLRLKELLNEEKCLANSVDELEKQEFQIQEYVSKKINTLENTVNSMFSKVKFKMFKDQINEGEKEDCIILIDGVPYSSANYAGRINAGLDIISTLSAEYGIKVPVFVDNAESVTKIMQLDQQMIELIADRKYQKLAVIESMKEAM
ncbi:MAG: hypothetical protein ACOWWH_07185 [Eubacteriaceae bacterium]